jgi:hypothetical protein
LSARRRIGTKERRRMIAEAAYFRAERRTAGRPDPVRDWLEAEAETDAQYEIAPLESALETLTERLHEANEHLRQTVVELRAEAREEWYAEIRRAKELRDLFSAKLEELRVQTGEAEQTLNRQAEKLWAELSQSLRRIGTR